VPEIAGLSEVPYFTSASIFDNPRKLTHLVIIGGGAVAVELAQAFRRLGSDVTLVDAAMPLAGSDPELAEIVLRRLDDEGVVVRPATEVTAVQLRSLGIGVSISSAAGSEVLDASHILVALGPVPNLDGLGLERAGVRTEQPGRLSLRPNLRTSNRLVYAAGDVTGGKPHTHAAAYHADLVVRNALFPLPVRLDPALIPSAVFTDPELAEVGVTEPEAAAQRKKYRVLRFSLAENDRARAERQTYGLIKLVVGGGGRLLGAGIAGTGAAEMISLFAFAIANHLSINHFRNFIAPYPTLTEMVRGLADEAARPDLEGPWLHRLLAFGRMLP
jgi:pyruvate/2-oxoglutarate dehydrogenase complex dihydrolipoamide dehydrogenase (E3) component